MQERRAFDERGSLPFEFGEFDLPSAEFAAEFFASLFQLAEPLERRFAFAVEFVDVPLENAELRRKFRDLPFDFLFLPNFLRFRLLERSTAGLESGQLPGEAARFGVFFLTFRSERFAVGGERFGLRRQFFERGGFGGELFRDLLDGGSGVGEFRFRLARRRVGVDALNAEFDRLSASASEFRRPIVDLRRLKIDGRRFGGDSFANAGKLRFDAAQLRFDVGQFRRGVSSRGLGGGDSLFGDRLKFGEIGRFDGRLLAFGRFEPPIEEGDFDAKFLQSGGVKSIIFRFAGLRFRFAELAFDFADQIGEAEQVLLDAFESTGDLLFFRVESGNARGLLQDGSALRARTLQQRLDAALFDDGVPLRPEPDAGDDLAKVFQTACVPVD